jgi:hypothetical protein
MADEITESGIWVDTQAGEIVHAEPEEGIVVLRPGQPITAEIQAELDAFEKAKEEAAKPDPAPDEPVAVTTKTASKK